MAALFRAIMHSMNCDEIDNEGFNSMAERNRTAILNEGNKMIYSISTEDSAYLCSDPNQALGYLTERLRQAGPGRYITLSESEDRAKEMIQEAESGHASFSAGESVSIVVLK